jgi:hypothetical protein
LSIKTGPLPNKILFGLLFTLLVELSLFAKTAESPETFKRVLVVNSYHEGYKWSDDIVKGIKTGLASNEDLIEIQIEYMDTQRVTDREYLTSLKTLYSYKFRDSQFDIILSSDDTAFDFLLLYGEELFPDIPIVFCGVNHFDEKRITENRQITGVVEGYDIKSTLETALMLHPETETMYYIDDDTTTGKAIMKEFQLVVPEFEDRLDFIRLDGRNLDLIEEKAKTLPDTSLIIFLIYFQDNQGTYFPYDSAISRLREASPVPIYVVWDFHLGYGIMGGKLTSGYYQGKMAADLALRVLAGEIAETIPVLTENTNVYKFDGRELKRFGIDVVELPKNSTIINFEGPLKKQILILNSYDKGFKWTLDLEE